MNLLIIWIVLSTAMLMFMAGCASIEEHELRCENHFGMVKLCKDPRFANDEQCKNPCGELDG